MKWPRIKVRVREPSLLQKPRTSPRFRMTQLRQGKQRPKTFLPFNRARKKSLFLQNVLEKSSSDCAEDQPSLINSVHLCLIVTNTILTVIHALKHSSLTHSLQIYCSGLTGPRSHTSWAWAAKRVPTLL